MIQAIQLALAFLPQFMQFVTVAVGLVEAVSAVTGDKSGAKKAAALAKLKEIYPASNLPRFLQPFYDTIAGFAIDTVVAIANHTGVFDKPALPTP